MSTTKTAKKTQAAPGNSNPNKGLGLENIDYGIMDGASSEAIANFNRYKEIEAKLLLNDKYDFEIWKATSVQKFKMDEDSGDKIPYTAGLILNAAKPIQKTRITAAAALEINKHVSHMKANEFTATSKYCLLAKPISE
ncbi:MAG: hypothetical protein JWR05_3493 [Mucilaginibacter sp.]|nr:hypothetical protein [Mucilaginibacter sp.]